MRKLFLIVCFLCLAMAAVAGVPRLASPTRTVSAQAPAIPPVSVTMYNNIINWSGDPGTMVRAQLRNAAGTTRANAMGNINASGLVTLTLSSGGGGGGPGMGGGGGRSC